MRRPALSAALTAPCVRVADDLPREGYTGRTTGTIAGQRSVRRRATGLSSAAFSMGEEGRGSERGVFAMANQVIFSGAPSQACNLPALLKGSAVMAIIGCIHLCALSAFPLQWHVLLAQAGAVLIGVSFPFVKTAFTRIVIDTTRITWTQGILHRRVSSLELSRVQRITSIHPWWLRLFGTATIILTTNDVAHPVRRLPGIRNADQICKRLDEAVAMHRERPVPANTFDPNAPDYTEAHSI
ncbi:PH domain-containing protein [Burkholderia sp. R-69927]|uniref:PH domain-containing protein n=1 Tax=Paraburkholderia domus TaxID=2793075 RepID=UPI001912A34F|nr:PH domain-containing protein [Paraburkholderia domus]MBK5087208.1 PH domain-containing protein [Burkholderia sp. R-69927]MBK5123563.1 PH domain-containing protein [Burkholderia sp. R-69980]MBK5166795.1 PH domain-containing protein [Burkholderia sp. R-70211]